MRRDYNVIIVGAGPAGAILACELAGKGTRALVLKKAVSPLTNQGNGAIVLLREGNNYYHLRHFVESRFASDKVVPMAEEECLD